MMTKKIAVLVRHHQAEAFRMSVGLTLVDDIIDVYLVDYVLDHTEQNMLNFELMKELGMKLYSNNKVNREMVYLTLQELSQNLTEYDHVVAY